MSTTELSSSLLLLFLIEVYNKNNKVSITFLELYATGYLIGIPTRLRVRDLPHVPASLTPGQRKMPVELTLPASPGRARANLHLLWERLAPEMVPDGLQETVETVLARILALRTDAVVVFPGTRHRRKATVL